MIAAEQDGAILIINKVKPCMPISHAARGNRVGRLIDRQRGEQGRCPQCLQELAMNSKCGAIVKACGATEQADGLRTMTTPDRQESCRNIVKCLFGGDRIKAAAFCTFQRMKQIGRASCRERVCQYV